MTPRSNFERVVHLFAGGERIRVAAAHVRECDGCERCDPEAYSHPSNCACEVCRPCCLESVCLDHAPAGDGDQSEYYREHSAERLG